MITLGLSKIMIQTLKVQTCFQSILCIFMYLVHIFTLFISIDSMDLCFERNFGADWLTCFIHFYEDYTSTIWFFKG